MKISKIFPLTLFLLLFSFTTNAKLRNADEAATFARSFIQNASGSALKAPFSSSALQAIQPFKIKSQIENLSSDNYFHVFNIGIDNGFVIISADDRAKTVLGYSDAGYFDAQNLPENLREWLGVYAGEIASLKNQPEINSHKITKVIQNNSESTFAETVAPLLKNIKWNQNSPYNLLCPIIDSTNNSRAAVGCGATALAMVMKYYNWPPAGNGSNSYTTKTLQIPLSVDFGATQYDWGNMTGIYNAASTETQKNAVATLMYHCAVAVNMDFDKSSSSYTTDIARSLFKYFGYDNNAQVYIRNYYTRNEWENMIKTELNNYRPVLYNGQAIDGGHIFVCDGYDANGLYHINWGWGGISDGYFELSALNPGELGIGGGNAGGYNSEQYMIIGIQKPSSASKPTYLIYTNEPLKSSEIQVNRNDTFSITTNNTYNYGLNTISGSLGLGLYNGNTLVKVLGTGNINVNGFYGWNKYTFKSQSIPTTVASGNYRIYFIYKPTSASDWSIVRGKVGTPNYLNVTIESSLIKFSNPTDVFPALTLNSLEKTGNLYMNKTGRFKARITNGGAEYNSQLRIYIESETNQEINQIITTDPVNIAAGETKEIEFKGIILVDSGTYRLGLMYDESNDLNYPISFVQLGSSTSVQVLDEPTGTPVLSLNNVISFADPQNIFTSNATLSANITNSGGYFEEKLIAFIFPTTSPSSSLTYIGYQSGILDSNESKTIKFSGSIALEAGEYRIAVYYWNPNSTATSKWTRIAPNDKSLIYFTLKDDLTDLSFQTVYSDTIFPNPATNYIYLKAVKKVEYVSIYDVFGKLIKKITPSNIGYIALNISDLKSGAYLLQVKNTDDITIHKFLKK